MSVLPELPGSFNIMLSSRVPAVPELFKLGVARISMGAAAMLATMGLIREIANELPTEETYEQLTEHAYGMGDAMRLFR